MTNETNAGAVDAGDDEAGRLARAEAELKAGEAEIKDGERKVERAEHEIEEVERHRREIDVKVDGKIKRVPAGTYVVSAFKELVGVAADRDLDVLKDGVLHPLADNEKITPHEGEVFVSHVRGGGSS